MLSGFWLAASYPMSDEIGSFSYGAHQFIFNWFCPLGDCHTDPEMKLNLGLSEDPSGAGELSHLKEERIGKD